LRQNVTKAALAAKASAPESAGRSPSQTARTTADRASDAVIAALTVEDLRGKKLREKTEEAAVGYASA
jgi:hypothetical protein